MRTHRSNRTASLGDSLETNRKDLRLRTNGLTLVELLVVIAIIGVLIALLLPAVQASREAARRAQCQNHLKQIGLAIQNFHDARRHLPASRLHNYYATWAVQILPYLEQRALYDEWDLGRTYYHQNATARTTSVATLYCPSRRNPGQTSTRGDGRDGRPTSLHVPGALADFACAVGDNRKGREWNFDRANGSIIYGRSCFLHGRIVTWEARTKFKDILDGLSNTVLVGEKHVRPEQFGFATGDAGDGSIYNGDHPHSFSRIGGPGYPLARFPHDSFRRNFGSYHPAICQFVLGDGSVQAVSVQVNTQVLSRLTVRDDGQPFGDY